MASDSAKNNNSLFFQCFSKDSLFAAWQQLRESSSNLCTHRVEFMALNKSNIHWFEATSAKLLAQKFNYPRKRYVVASADVGSLEENRFTELTSFRIKVIERAILNVIEPFFEGVWRWEEITCAVWDRMSVDPQVSKNAIKRTKQGYFKKA